MKKLGKGLDALISSGVESTDKTTGITTVKVDKIIPNRFQPRKEFDKQKLQELSNSLKESGIIQPIIVTKKDETQYELIAGERRLEASKLAGFEDIPVIIRSVSPRQQLQFAIIENVQREDLNAVEEAKAYQQLNGEFELTHTQIAEIVGKDRATISNLIRLLNLEDDIQQLVLNKVLTPGHARTILQVKEPLRKDFAELIIKEKLSVRKAEQAAKRIKETGSVAKQRPKPEKKTDFSKYEKKLSGYWKTKISITGKKSSGKISLYYNSEKEFAKLLNMLEGKDE